MTKRNTCYIYMGGYFDYKFKKDTNPYAYNCMFITAYRKERDDEFKDATFEQRKKDDINVSSKVLPIGAHFVRHNSVDGRGKTKHQIMLEAIKDIMNHFLANTDNRAAFYFADDGLVNDFKLIFFVNQPSIDKVVFQNIAPAVRNYFAPVFEDYTIDKYLKYYTSNYLDKYIANRDLVIEIIHSMISLHKIIFDRNVEIKIEQRVSKIPIQIPVISSILRKFKDEPILKVLEQQSRADALISAGVRNYRRTKEERELAKEKAKEAQVINDKINSIDDMKKAMGGK